LQQRQFGQLKVCENYHKVESRQAIFSGFAVRERPCYELAAMRRAVIDIGTNTVKVLVADVQQDQVVPVLAKDRTTRLGEGVDEHQRLSAAAILRTLQAIDEFHTETKALGSIDVIALTTSACRDAANRNEFFDAVRQKCGLEVQLISGDREAELIF